MISLIHPSRGRPEKSFETISKWMAMCANPSDIEVIVGLDRDDPLRQSYDRLHIDSMRVYADNRSAVDAINNAAYQSIGDIIIVVSDDTECPKNWDELIKAETLNKTYWILKTQDGIQNWIITMPVMDRAYYNRFGYIYHPDYLHMFCDTELSCVADLTGRRITSNLLFKHNHYSVTGAPKDAISAKADATWEQGEKLFVERYKKMFDLKLGDIKGKITDKGMINWIARK